MEIGMGILGWTPQQFWAATLPDLLAAYKGYQSREDRQDLRAGMMIAAVYEQNRNTEKRSDPITAYDFFPHLKPKQVVTEEGTSEEEEDDALLDYLQKLKGAPSADD